MEKNSEANIKIKYKLEFVAFKTGIFILKILPYRLSLNILIFASKIIKKRKDVAIKNLRKVFNDEQKIRTILNKTYENYAKNIAETYLADTEKLFKKVKTVGWENLEEALSLNRGVILASAHLGNWELAGSYIATRKKISVIIKRQKNPLFNKYMIESRNKMNIKVIDMKTSLREVMKDLKNNYIVTILIDQNAGRRGIKTDFLSHPASTYAGTAKIALKTKSPIVPAFAVRDKNDINTFYFEKPIYTDNLEYNDENIKKITDELNKILEKYILTYPEQWFWVHKRWKGAKQAKVIGR